MSHFKIKKINGIDIEKGVAKVQAVMVLEVVYN